MSTPQDWFLLLILLLALAVLVAFVAPLLPWARLRSVRLHLPWLDGAMKFDPPCAPRLNSPPPASEEGEERAPEPTHDGEAAAAGGKLRYRIATDEER